MSFLCPSCRTRLTVTMPSDSAPPEWPPVEQVINPEGVTVREVAAAVAGRAPTLAEMERTRRWLYRQLRAGTVRVKIDSSGTSQFWLTGASASG